MNSLAIDFGLKRIGLAYTQNNIIFTLPQLANDQELFAKIRQIVDRHHINRVYVGLAEGQIATHTLKFITRLQSQLQLPVDTVEEAVSTIEAGDLYRKTGKKKSNFRHHIDSFSAAVILGRALGYN